MRSDTLFCWQWRLLCRFHALYLPGSMSSSGYFFFFKDETIRRPSYCSHDIFARVLMVLLPKCSSVVLYYSRTGSTFSKSIRSKKKMPFLLHKHSKEQKPSNLLNFSVETPIFWRLKCTLKRLKMQCASVYLLNRQIFLQQTFSFNTSVASNII